MITSAMVWSYVHALGTAVQVFVVNVVLSADNALLIALAARRLPLPQRRIAILAGGSLAILLRIALTLVATCLLRIPGLLPIGGLLLFYVAWRLVAHDDADNSIHTDTQNILAAVRIIAVADLAMSLDNILAVAGASGGDLRQMLLGLITSVTFIVFCSGLIAALMNRYRGLVYVGAAAIGMTASEMILPSAMWGLRAVGMSAVAVMACLTFHSHAVADDPVEKAAITEAEVNAAQKAWCDGLVKIGKAYKDGGDYKAAASQLIDDLYDYKEGTVFFKPTLAYGKNTFRSTKAGALSYYVGGNKDFPEDTGFALKQWVKVRYEDNAAENGIQIHGNIAITMGNLYLTNAKGEEVLVDKTFVFRKCQDGKLRLCAHKSALPFDPSK